MGQEIFQVDAFTREPFSGNPAGVCVMTDAADEAWMQRVAAEMNLSETAFLYPEDGEFNLRWFTPAMEVGLCGHATLASAHVLWEEGHLPSGKQARFRTRSGLLTADRIDDLIELALPAEPPQPAQAPRGVTEALGVSPKYTGKGRMNYLIEVETEDVVRGLSPDFSALSRLPPAGYIVTSEAPSSGYDFVSRFLVPTAGIDEDPVTGSAHCCLGPYWMERLGKDTFVAYQASARGGVVYVRVDGDRVHVGGHAVTVIRGELV